MDRQIRKVINFLLGEPLEEHMSDEELARLQQGIKEARLRLRVPNIDGLALPEVDSISGGCAVKQRIEVGLYQSYCGNRYRTMTTYSFVPTCPHCIKAYHDPDYCRPPPVADTS